MESCVKEVVAELEAELDRCVDDIDLEVLRQSKRSRRLWLALQGFQMGLVHDAVEVGASPSSADGGHALAPLRAWMKSLPHTHILSYRKRWMKLRIVAFVSRLRAETGVDAGPQRDAVSDVVAEVMAEEDGEASGGDALSPLPLDSPPRLGAAAAAAAGAGMTRPASAPDVLTSSSLVLEPGKQGAGLPYFEAVGHGAAATDTSALSKGDVAIMLSGAVEEVSELLELLGDDAQGAVALQSPGSGPKAAFFGSDDYTPPSKTQETFVKRLLDLQAALFKELEEHQAAAAAEMEAAAAAKAAKARLPRPSVMKKRALRAKIPGYSPLTPGAGPAIGTPIDMKPLYPWDSPADAVVASSLARPPPPPAFLTAALGKDSPLYKLRVTRSRTALLQAQGAHRALACLQYGLSWSMAGLREDAKRQHRAAISQLFTRASVASDLVWSGMELAWARGAAAVSALVRCHTRAVRTVADLESSPVHAKVMDGLVARMAELEPELKQVEAGLAAGAAAAQRAQAARFDVVRARATSKAVSEAVVKLGRTPALLELRGECEARLREVPKDDTARREELMETRRQVLGELLALSRAAEWMLGTGLGHALSSLEEGAAVEASCQAAFDAVVERAAAREASLEACVAAQARLSVFSGAPESMLAGAQRALSLKRRECKQEALALGLDLDAGFALAGAHRDAKQRRREAEAALASPMTLHPSDRPTPSARLPFPSRSESNSTRRFHSRSNTSVVPTTPSSRSLDSTPSTGAADLPPIADLRVAYASAKAAMPAPGAAPNPKAAVARYQGSLSFWVQAAPQVVVMPPPGSDALPGSPFHADTIARRTAEVKLRLEASQATVLLYTNAKAAQMRLGSAAGRLWVAKRLRAGVPPARLRELLRFKAGAAAAEASLLSGWHARSWAVRSKAYLEGMADSMKSLAWDVDNDRVALARRVRGNQWAAARDVVASAGPAAVTRLRQVNAFVLQAAIDLLRSMGAAAAAAAASTPASTPQGGGGRGRAAVGRAHAPPPLMLGPPPRWQWPPGEEWQAAAAADARVQGMLERAYTAEQPDTVGRRRHRMGKRLSHLEPGVRAACMSHGDGELELETLADGRRMTVGKQVALEREDKRRLLTAVGCFFALQRLNVAAMGGGVDGEEAEEEAEEEDSEEDEEEEAVLGLQAVEL